MNTLMMLVASGAAFLVATAAAAQERERADVPDTLALPEIVVTATRVPLHRDALPTPVVVLTGEDLRARGVRTVAEALRGVVGAVVARAGSDGAQTSLFLRGGESDYVKVLIDGVPVNDPGGSLDLADLSTDLVERIEVVPGPVSVLYGSDAVAGVIQVFTRRGRGDPTISAAVSGGRGRQIMGGDDFSALDAEAAISGRAGRVGYSAGASRTWSEGIYPFNNQRALHVAGGRLGWTGAAADAALTLRFTDSEARFPTDGSGNVVDQNARLDRRALTAAAEVARRFGRFDARVQLGLRTRRQAAIDRPDGPGDTLGIYAEETVWDVARRTADARVSTELLGAHVTAGAALEWADAETSYASQATWGPFDAGADYRRVNRGYYAQVLAQPLSRLHLTLGTRLDDSDAFGTFATYRAGAALGLDEDTRLRAAIGRGFREPTFAESFGSGFGDLGNPGLSPERSASWEAGAERLIGDVRLSATWFDQAFRDLIQFTFVPPAEGDPNYFNVGEARARGLEVGAEGAVGPIGLRTSYTWLETEVLDPGLATDASFAQGEPLLRRPAHAASVVARYALPRGLVAATLTVVGERDDLDFQAGFPAPRIALPAYATLDLALSHALGSTGVDATLEIDNALDAEYEGVAGFPAPRRMLRLGLRMRYER